MSKHTIPFRCFHYSAFHPILCPSIWFWPPWFIQSSCACFLRAKVSQRAIQLWGPMKVPHDGSVNQPAKCQLKGKHMGSKETRRVGVVPWQPYLLLSIITIQGWYASSVRMDHAADHLTPTRMPQLTCCPGATCARIGPRCDPTSTCCQQAARPTCWGCRHLDTREWKAAYDVVFILKVNQLSLVSNVSTEFKTAGTCSRPV